MLWLLACTVVGLSPDIWIGLPASRKAATAPPEGSPLLLARSANQPLTTDLAGEMHRDFYRFLCSRLAPLVRATERTAFAKSGAAPKKSFLSLDAPQWLMALRTPGNLNGNTEPFRFHRTDLSRNILHQFANERIYVPFTSLDGLLLFVPQSCHIRVFGLIRQRVVKLPAGRCTHNGFALLRQVAALKERCQNAVACRRCSDAAMFPFLAPVLLLQDLPQVIVANIFRHARQVGQQGCGRISWSGFGFQLISSGICT